MTDQNNPNKRWLQWLIPGLGVKRWFGLLLAGAALIGLGFAMLLVEFYRLRPSPLWSYALQIARLPLWVMAILAGLGGLGLTILSAIRINRAILAPLELDSDEILSAMRQHRQRQRGPRIVAIGGGTGMPTLLSGLKEYTSNLTAIVTVADDGGSSGKLRAALGVLPPGDFRNNLAALARDQGLMTQLFQYRFGEGDLEGHSFGNLFITAMSGITGSFEQALVESSRVLAIRGQVLPSTTEHVTLMAELRELNSQGMRRVSGESAIPHSQGRIDRVFLQPDDAPAFPDARRAILGADLIVIGPGSLFTSILPNLLVRDIARALRASKAVKVYVCNVATQAGETEGFSVLDHVRAIERHVGERLFEHVLYNTQHLPLPADSKTVFVQPDDDGLRPDLTLHGHPLVDTDRPWRHDSGRLARAVIKLLKEARQPLQPVLTEVQQ